MRHNKRVGDEIFDPKKIEIHPQSFLAVHGRRIEDFTDEELLNLIAKANYEKTTM